MVISKKVLEKLQGVNPCTASVSFVPKEYDSMREDEEMKEFLPTFHCNVFTNEQVEGVKTALFSDTKKKKEAKKKTLLKLVKESVTGWENLYDLSSGELIEFSPDNVDKLTEVLLESILVELSQYAGFIPRNV